MDKLSARSTICQQFANARTFPIRYPSLQIDEAPLEGLVRLQGTASDPLFRTAVSVALAVSLPEPERVCSTAAVRVAWAGPDEWICFCPLAMEERCVDDLNEALTGQFATVTLVSDSRVAFVVTGHDAAAFLSKGCAIDMDPVEFEIGHVVTTRFAGLPAMLAHRNADTYSLHFDAGSADFLLSWIIDAAEEFMAP